MFSLTQTAAAQSVRVTAPKRDVSRRCVFVCAPPFSPPRSFFSSSSFFRTPRVHSNPTLCGAVLERRHDRILISMIAFEIDRTRVERRCDALKKRSKKKRTCLVPLPWSSLRVSFFFASKKETGRRARAPDRGSLTHQCAWVTWHVCLSATFLNPKWTKTDCQLFFLSFFRSKQQCDSAKERWR